MTCHVSVVVSADSVVWSKAITQFRLVEVEEFNSRAQCPTLTRTLKHIITQSVVGPHKSFSTSLKNTNHVGQSVFNKWNKHIILICTNLRQVFVREDKRQGNTLHVVRYEIGLVCPITLKNYIPEALQVQFTKTQTQKGGGPRLTLCSKLPEPGSPGGKWWLAARVRYHFRAQSVYCCAISNRYKPK